MFNLFNKIKTYFKNDIESKTISKNKITFEELEIEKIKKVTALKNLITNNNSFKLIEDEIILKKIYNIIKKLSNKNKKDIEEINFMLGELNSVIDVYEKIYIYAGYKKIENKIPDLQELDKIHTKGSVKRHSKNLFNVKNQ